MKKSILCFGDSNTWGYAPGTGLRYDLAVRWPGVLQERLGEGYAILEEGLNGRTTLGESAFGRMGHGANDLSRCLDAHQPLDLVILLLGTNDLGVFFDQTMDRIAARMARLVTQVLESQAGVGGSPPQVLLLAPPPVKSPWPDDSTRTLVGKSRQFGEHYSRTARELGCGFLDTGVIIESSAIDGFHLDPSAHRKLGLAVADWVIASLAESR